VGLCRLERKSSIRTDIPQCGRRLPQVYRFGILGWTVAVKGTHLDNEHSAISRNEQLFASLYSDLRRLAESQLRGNQGVSISPTTLLHEAYLGMSGRDALFPDRERFMGYAARVMRGLIIDFVRERRALKRGAAYQITQLPNEVPSADAAELTRLSEALDELATRDPRLAEVVDLRYFCGFTLEDIAAQRGASVRTVQRDWEKARIILFEGLGQPG
jgi:RNA polymerase sigma factor (TIGR02999 family)